MSNPRFPGVKRAKRTKRSMVKNSRRGLWTLICLLSAGAAVGAPCPDGPEAAELETLCGVPAPEDIAAIDGRYLVVSSMQPSRQLYLLDTQAFSLGPMATRLESPPRDQRWGDPECLLPATLETHGLSIGRRGDGILQLLAVNHGDRESVEFFAVTRGSDEAPELVWRGCVMAARNAQFNDVALLPDGGFLATDPVRASWRLPRMLLGAAGVATGKVYRWRPSRGYEPVPQTEGAYPNGILLAPDGRSFFLNVYLDGEVRQHDLASGDILGRVAIDKPDNSSWSRSGELLVASHEASVLALLRAISAAPGKRNRIPFSIIALDPEDFSTRVVYRSDGATLGGGTIAQEAGGSLYIGAFRGDRILRVGPAALSTP
jgi:hypothetical protein